MNLQKYVTYDPQGGLFMMLNSLPVLSGCGFVPISLFKWLLPMRGEVHF